MTSKLTHLFINHGLSHSSVEYQVRIAGGGGSDKHGGASDGITNTSSPPSSMVAFMLANSPENMEEA